MGGDHGPAVVVEGAATAVREFGASVILVGDRDASGSVEGCANSTVTCARTSSFRCSPAIVPTVSPHYKRILRVVAVACGHSRGTSFCRVPYPEGVRGDGDGWVLSDSGAAFWGRHGAAGLLLRAPRDDGSAAVLLQHRAPWSHQGGTWGLPGGARDSHETPEQAAVREAHEEAGLPPEQLTVRTTVVTAEVSGWTYTTVIADASQELDTVPNRESAELRWVAEDDVAELPLHPGFAASWDRLREVAATIPLLQAEL